MGDFVVSHLSKTVNVFERNALIVKIYKSHLERKQTLCFCVDVAHALSLSDAFHTDGIRAAAVTGDMDRTERAKVLKDFSVGKIQVLANCMVLTEGYDEPSVEGIILARPTKSTLLYTQMIGRGTRLYPGKKNVTVIDVVDVTRAHSLTTLPSLFGLSERFDFEGHTTDEVEKAIRWTELNRPWVPIERAISLSDLRYRCKKIELFDLKTPNELLDYAQYAWVHLGKGGYRLGLTGGDAIVVSSTILGHWEVRIRQMGKEHTLASKGDLRSAVLKAESLVRGQYRDLLPLVERDTQWRREPATEKQVHVLLSRKLGVPKGLTKGQASHLIGMLS